MNLNTVTPFRGLNQNPIIVTEEPQSIMALLGSNRGDQNVRSYVLSFLEPRELAVVESMNKSTSRVWRQAAEPCWRTQAIIQRMIPVGKPVDMSYSQIFKNLYPGALGPQFYEDSLGDVGPVPPIPREYIEAATRPDQFGGWIKDNCQLTLIPEFITITVGAESPMTLNENGRLVEDPAARGAERRIQVPVTLRNVATLTEKCLRKGTPIGFSEHSWPNILNQHGDARVKSHWFYPRKDPVGFGRSYNEQQVLAVQAGLEVTPLIDMAIYYLLKQIRSANADMRYVARTSTLILDIQVPSRAWPSSLWWKASGPSARLSLSRSHFDGGVGRIGVAVGVPAGSSRAIGFFRGPTVPAL